MSKASFNESLRVGPIALGALGATKHTQLPPARRGQQRFLPIESVAFVKSGATVTIAVAVTDRRHAGLIYDKRKFRDDGLYRIQGVDDVVRFEACGDPHFNHGYSQFDGGIVVAGRRCFSLDIYFDGRHYRRRGLLDC